MNGRTNFTVKEIVVEIRDELRELTEKIDRIDREGSIGTREELRDHENRIRGVERWRWAVPGVGAIAAIAFAIDLINR